MKIEQSVERDYPGSNHRTATRAGAGVLVLAALAGCHPSTPSKPSAKPSAHALPSCGPEGGGGSPYGIHFGISPDELPKLLGDKGAAMQATEWTLVKNEIDEVIKGENPPQGMHFVVSAEVGYDTVPKATAEQEADQLARLASQKLDYPIGGGPNDAYPAQDGNATLHIVNPDAGTPINSCNL